MATYNIGSVFSKLYILTKLKANDVKFIPSDREKLDLLEDYTHGTVNSIFVEIQPNSMNIKNAPRNYVESGPMGQMLCKEF